MPEGLHEEFPPESTSAHTYR
uniref:Uncharacterized protein n=1 Tax=Anguilla anguilla TaxID=7936 RepID=A0A0E9XA15_ANGAN